MQRLKFDMRAWAPLASLIAATSLFSVDAMAAKMSGDPAATCGDLIRPTDNAVRIDSASIVAPTPLAVAERGPTPAARVTPANPEFCKVLGQIAPSDPNPPAKLYFMGSSEGGREALTMAQRYPDDFDGIFARVPVINWVGLQHAGTRSGLATMGEGWIRPAQVELVAKAVLQACDKADGAEDLLVLDPVGCKAKFQPESLRCAAGQGGDACLTEPQIAAVKTLHSTYKFAFPLENGLDDYPGWGVSGENTPAFGPTGGWSAWWLGKAAPAQPPVPANGIAWIYGAGGIQYVFARDPKLDVTTYKPEEHKERLLQVSRLMD